VPNKQASIEPFTLIKRINTQHINSINFLSWSNDSRFLFSSSDDNAIHIYAVFSLKGYATKKLIGHRSQVKAVFQQKDYVCSIGADGFLYLWKLVEDEKKVNNNFENFKSGK
jgi:WD40 repeat protein